MEPSGISGPAWLEAFRARHGRGPRILHIGNIANNAYLNAKILNRVGLHNDVLCYSYYHIMGCPEWEDADIPPDAVIDHFKPDWAKLNLQDYARPEWFAQGPLLAATEYLVTRLNGTPQQKDFQRKRCTRLAAEESGLLTAAAGAGTNEAKSTGPASNGRKGARFAHLLRKAVKLLCLHPNEIVALLRPQAHQWSPAKAVVGYLILAYCSTYIALSNLGRVLVRTAVSVPKPTWLESVEDGSWINREKMLCAVFHKDFPGREDSLRADDLKMYSDVIRLIQPMLRHYDIIQGYATDGIYGLLADVPFVAYEHGTIRHLPFQATTQGRLCALTYREADHVCITNCDNIDAAQRLGLERYTFVPHPINEDHAPDERSYALRAELHQDADFVVFHPARQHWSAERHPDWEKGNDYFIEGFARFVHQINPRARAVLVEWGQSVADSRALLEKLGVDDRVSWVPPQSNRSMLRYVYACEVVADQFYLGAFGSTMPKALMCGVPAMLYLNEATHGWCFPEMPPVVNARSADQVFEGLRSLYQDSTWARELGQQGRAWYEKYHSNRVISERLLDVYGQVLQARSQV